MLGSSGSGGAKPNPMMRATNWLSLTMAFALTFVFTPQIHGGTVDWALGYMDQNYGGWMVAIGWYLWWLIVALLTFFVSNLVLMLGIMLGQFGLMTAGARMGR